jgi:hypothetical protein
MPDLAHTLQSHDLGFLKMVAGLWGIELNAPDARKALPILENEMLDAELLTEVIETLPDGAKIALQEVLRSDGVLLWSQFCRKFGEVRIMGASRRDRERPDLTPANSAEVLWYRGLIGKAFLSLSTEEPQEYAYIPEDFLEFVIDLLPPPQETLLGRPASPAEFERQFLANDRVLDHACTLLAATRSGIQDSQLDDLNRHIPLEVLRALLQACGCLDAHLEINPDRTRQLLEAPRAAALHMLAHSWLISTSFNELRLLPHLSFEGDWNNNPISARQTTLETISKLPSGKWWNIHSLISAIKEQNPDFQRPAGDYDSWFIRSRESGEYLRGFAAWEKVDGELIRFLITGPLHWLGLVDLASPPAGSTPTAFRLSAWSAELLNGQPPSGLAEENAPVRVNSQGIIDISNLTPRSVRYQIARFCEWQGSKELVYRYRLAAHSLAQAKKQSLLPRHLVVLLKQHSGGQLPPGILQALDKWEQKGSQARQQNVVLLRVESAEILEALKKSRSARHISEVLSPTIAIVKADSTEKIRAALLEMGFICDFESQD